MFNIFESIFSRRWLASLQMGWSMSPVIMFAEKYLFSDIQFIIHMIIVIGVDTILGTILSLKKKTFSSSGFGKLFAKLFVYLILLIAIHNISKYQVNGQANTLLNWVDGVVYATIMIRELVSIFEKTTLLGFFKPPRWLVERFAMFEETGSFEKAEKKE